MVPKVALVICFCFLFFVSSVDAQREGRRRTGRRKTTTEIPPQPTSEPEEEKHRRKSDPEPEIAKTEQPSSDPQAADSKSEDTPVSKDMTSNNGPPFLTPRGTRKPRPIAMRSGVERRPKPTLPIFVRKSSGRVRKQSIADVKRNDADSPDATTISTTVTKPTRGGSRRRNNAVQAQPQPDTEDDSQLKSAPKKRFGGGLSRRGSRRSTTATPEA